MESFWQLLPIVFMCPLKNLVQFISFAVHPSTIPPPNVSLWKCIGATPNFGVLIPTSPIQQYGYHSKDVSSPFIKHKESHTAGMSTSRCRELEEVGPPVSLQRKWILLYILVMCCTCGNMLGTRKTKAKQQWALLGGAITVHWLKFNGTLPWPTTGSCRSPICVPSPQYLALPTHGTWGAMARRTCSQQYSCRKAMQAQKPHGQQTAADLFSFLFFLALF